MLSLKKILFVILTVSLILPVGITERPLVEINHWDGTVSDGFDSGTGTVNDPYIIKTASQLAYFTHSSAAGNSYKGKYIKLANTIDFNNGEWLPVKEFSGHFDGGGNSICNWRVSYHKGDVGLFGSIYGGTVENLGVMNYKINVESRVSTLPLCVGGIVGILEYGSTINKCYAYGDITAYSELSDVRAGGISGEATKSTICDSFSAGNVKASVYTLSAKKFRTDIGGFAGYTREAEISRCYTTASVTGSNPGRFLGWCDAELSLCYYSGAKDFVNAYGYLQNLSGIGAVMLSSDEALKITSFDGWNFDGVWDINFFGTYKWPTLSEVPVFNHKLVIENREKASCDETGKIFYSCEDCTEMFFEVIPATEHEYGDWTIITEADYNVDGLKIRKCSLCDKEEREIIPMLVQTTTETSTETTTTSQEITTTETSTETTTSVISEETTTTVQTETDTSPSDKAQTVKIFVVIIIICVVILIALGILIFLIKRKKQ